MKYLIKIETIILDGTFENYPSQFFQVFTIHGFILGKLFPLFFIYWLINKRTLIWNLQIILNNIYRNWKFLRFWEGDIKCCKHSFWKRWSPRLYISIQPITWRKFQEMGFQKKYFNNESFKKVFNIINNLVLFHWIHNSVLRKDINSYIGGEFFHTICHFINYFEKTYLGKKITMVLLLIKQSSNCCFGVTTPEL
jgi:hypothetical protein